jgi:hypothetical protein
MNVTGVMKIHVFETNVTIRILFALAPKGVNMNPGQRPGRLSEKPLSRRGREKKVFLGQPASVLT